MATITNYTKKNGQKAWQFQTYLGVDEITGKQRYTTRRGFATKKECTLALNKLLLEIEEHGFVQNKIMTFEQLYEDWLPKYRNKVKPSTVAATITVFDLYILPRFKKMRLDKITVAYCQKVLDGWYEEYRGYKGFKMKLNLVLDYAVSLELITTNPMKKTQTPRQKEKDKPVNFYTKQQLQAFLSLYESEGDQMKYVFFHLLAYTGLRKSEALALQYSDINFLKHELTVGRTVAVNEDSEIIIQSPKTKNSYRTINLDPVTMQLIQEWQKEQREWYFKLGFNTNKKDQLIFSNNQNKAIRPSLVNGWLRNFYNRHEDMQKITAHGFRFTHCSLLFESGASMKEVQGRLGHKDVQTTMNIYAKVTPKMATNTGEKFALFMAN
ncbi:site-specific integrase [Enterococcus xiangfangensis]|uniref:site-specific integrase n=1 Tax=Enterococcus xiangfangensis TaxID=1296537 RepID=UPI0010F464E7|nr:site-specific integrase [Enterococcus xiangfangensis]MBM7712451.1 integrase [Enterococcus xiangfangensis]